MDEVSDESKIQPVPVDNKAKKIFIKQSYINIKQSNKKKYKATLSKAKTHFKTPPLYASSHSFKLVWIEAGGGGRSRTNIYSSPEISIYQRCSYIPPSQSGEKNHILMAIDSIHNNERMM